MEVSFRFYLCTIILESGWPQNIRLNETADERNSIPETETRNNNIFCRKIALLHESRCNFVSIYLYIFYIYKYIHPIISKSNNGIPLILTPTA